MGITKKTYLKEMFEYRKALKKHPIFPENFNFEENINFYNDSNKKRIDFEYYNIPLLTDLSTIEYVERLFSWIGSSLKHNGYTKYRGPLYGGEILEYAIDKGEGINCLMHGILLQEILFQSGFNAHLVQSNPYDYKIGDCHWLINLYVKEFNKWMMIDPVWLGFCTNSEGIPLDFFEIRKSIIEKEPFFVNKQNKVKYYEYLMCRYLFFFGFFKFNGIGTFEKNNQQKIYIAPQNFDGQLFVCNKEKSRFLPFDLEEYLYFSRFEESSIYIVN